MANRKYSYLYIPRLTEEEDFVCARYMQDGRAKIIAFNENNAPWAIRGTHKPLVYYISVAREVIAEKGWQDDLTKYLSGKIKYHVNPGERFVPAKGWLFEITKED